MPALLPDGSAITCDGCGAAVEEVTPQMTHPAPEDVWGPGVSYIVCRPLEDQTQPCLTLAELSDELYRTVRCNTPGCGGC